MSITFFKKAEEKKFIQKSFNALGTINTITAAGKNVESAIDEAQKRVLQIHRRMSAFEEDSDISKINKSAGIVAEQIKPDTFEILMKAKEFSEKSNGAFDITIRPLTALWGFRTKLNFIPSNKEVTRVLHLVNYKDLILDKKNLTAELIKEGQAIDLGGIAKGYAADEVKRIFSAHKIVDALINLGGNIVTMGSNFDGKPWNIGIQNPLEPRGKYIGTINLSNKTIVTSGSNEQFFIVNGRRYHHIINPRTGFPVNNKVLSVTVICDSSVDADALSTALFVSDFSMAKELLSSFSADAVYVMQDGNVFVSDGLKDKFERSF